MTNCLLILRTVRLTTVVATSMLLALLAGCGADQSGFDDAVEAPHSLSDDHGEGSSQSHGESHTDSPAEAPLDTVARPAVIEAKIKIKSGEGKSLYSIKWKEDGAKLVDANEQELARFNVSDDGAKVKIKDRADKVLGYLVGAYASGRVKIEDPSQEKELFKFIRQEDGDWKLEDPADKLLIRVKQRDYGVELETANDTSLYKVKSRDGKTSLRDASDKTLWYTNSPVRPLSFACLAFDPIQDIRIRAALMMHLQNVHGSQ